MLGRKIAKEDIAEWYLICTISSNALKKHIAATELYLTKRKSKRDKFFEEQQFFVQENKIDQKEADGIMLVQEIEIYGRYRNCTIHVYEFYKCAKIRQNNTVDVQKDKL